MIAPPTNPDLPLLSPRLATLAALAAALALAACGDNGQATDDPDASITPTADAAAAVDAQVARPGLTMLDYVIAVDVSPDGGIAVFEELTSTVTAVLIDTVTGDVIGEVEVGDPSHTMATGISSDGQLTAMHGEPVVAGVWSAAGGWRDLASPFPTGCDLDLGSAWDISASGGAVTGMMWHGCHPEAFRWTEAGGVVSLDVLGSPGGSQPASNRATVISDDGTVSAGFAADGVVDRSAALWHADGTGMLLDTTVTDAPSEVLSIDASGTTLAGIHGYDGFVWTEATGKTPLVRFDIALPSDPVYPNAMTADGTTIFGGVGDAFFSVPTAFMWTAAGGMVPLIDVVRAAGIAVEDGVILSSVLGASADGTVLIGTAFDADGATKTFLLRLPG